jgi:DNA-binding LytR/AlgR family response regulator
MPKSKVLTLQSFKKIEELLPPNNFVRVHKSFIVALDKIESIERNRIKIGERLIPIGESFSKNFYNLLSERKLF